MWKQHLSNFTLKIIEKCFSTLTRPFLAADSLPNYSRRGYFLLGFILATPIILLWLKGYLSAPLSQSHPIVRGVYKALAEKTVVLSYIPDSYISLVLIPIIIYLLLFLWPSKLQLIGETTANICFWILEKVINIGEWYIEHRWHSFFLIISLSFILAALITFEAYKFSDERKLRSDFDYWLKDAGDFVRFNPVTEQEIERYARVKSYWRNDFNAILKLPDGSNHPALCLNYILDELYSKQEEKAWNDILQRKVEPLNEHMSKCVPHVAENMDLAQARAWASMNMLMGRINVRLSGDSESQNYSNYHELVKALRYFEAVEKLQYKAPEDSKHYRSDASNGKGTIYSNTFSAYIRGQGSTSLNQEQLNNLKVVCANPAQCAMRALESYEDAAKGFEPCSYQGKRKLNNTTDLMLRIGHHYKDVAKELTSHPFINWMRTPLSLANEIEQHIQNLMTCNASKPFLSTFALTAAQGYGVSARLKSQAGVDAAPNLLTAARYLRLANSFEPLNISKWDLSYFCLAVTDQAVSPSFIEAIRSTPDGLPSAEGLLEMIQKKCQ
ncbi:MAG TPA: hypothetical protein VEY11_07160 [Pyrinomonadaceae bacterium]|nr:hypothetical protein [Pyrinomonadaceae bacterium]